MLYLPEEARFQHLVGLPEGADLGKAINDAMAAIERTNPDLDGVLTFRSLVEATQEPNREIYAYFASRVTGD